MKFIIGVLTLLPLCLFGKTIIIVDKNAGQEFDYCKSELQSFLNPSYGFSYTNNKDNADWVVALSMDPRLEESSFCVKSLTKGDKTYTYLSGRSSSDILCAVYTLLEKLGYTFELSGYKAPEKVDFAAIKNYSEKIIPVVKYRGIRQHINFPMDISSYAINDAKEYLRNLARMRFNFIVFHCYPGQWYELKEKDTTILAGNFFYGYKYPIPDDPFFRKHIANKNVYCIPEIEPYYDNAQVKSRMAVQWLNQVIDEAKRVGMKVQLSFEPRSTSFNVDSTIDMIRQIQKQFPKVDAFELMTEESGGWGPSNTAAETKQYLKSFFGKDILNDTMVVKYIQPKQNDLGYLYGQIGHVIKTIQTIKERKLLVKELKIGIYCDGKYNVPVYYLARKCAPQTEIAILPSHGSTGVAKAVPNLVKTKADWESTQIYSWLEFDGMMFLQQNGIDGIHELMTYQKSNFPSVRINTLAFNHWRTAENKVTARYAALATINGDIEPSTFYVGYAKRLGISEAASFSKAMTLIGTAYDFRKSNMAFAWLGYWKNGIHFEDASALQKQFLLYQDAAGAIKKCFAGSDDPYARNTVKFLDNRLKSTLLYFQAYLKQTELKDKGLSREQYIQISDSVLGIYHQCLKTYAEMMPDRGCQGALINLYLGPVRAVEFSRYKRTGIPMTIVDEQKKRPADSPAPPIFKH